MGLIRIPNGRRSRKPATALCKAPVQGIVVAKPPQPKPATQIIATRIQERFGPLSTVAVPAIRKMVDPVQRFQQLTKLSHPLPKPRKAKGPKSRILTPEDVAQRKLLADQITKILKFRLKSASKQTLICQFSGTVPAGAISAGLRIAIRRGDVIKNRSVSPSRYSFAPVAQVANGWTTAWTQPIETGWVTHL
jgi:hypothetical protein